VIGESTRSGERTFHVPGSVHESLRAQAPPSVFEPVACSRFLFIQAQFEPERLPQKVGLHQLIRSRVFNITYRLILIQSRLVNSSRLQPLVEPNFAGTPRSCGLDAVQVSFASRWANAFHRLSPLFSVLFFLFVNRSSLFDGR